MRTKILFLALSVTLLVRCNDDTNLTPTEKIKTSVWVSIVDASGNPVKDAQVAIGEHTGLTDVDGNYFFSSVLGNTDMFLKAEKFGFFPGSRRFYPSKNKIEYVNINLLPYIEKGVFNTASPVVITVDSKSSLTFPDIAVAHENGSLYSGEVHVMANSIYADDPDLSKKMPGNLTGINDVGNSFVLGSYGMLAVELQDGSGQKLQITPGKFEDKPLGDRSLP
ncbi:MAG: carboxypeptidase-like regulatory domain-containing protein, partial [Saprospiraceae bacterium]